MAILDLVTAISNDVVAKLAAASLPPLTDGQIVVGRVRVNENSYPPRVIFIPKASRFEPKSTPVFHAAQNPKNPQSPGSGIRALLMTQYGGGYTGTPTATISAPDLAGGVNATASAVIGPTGGSIQKLVITNAGSGYVNPPTVTIAGTGTGATATATLNPTAQGLAVIAQRALFTEVVQFEVQIWGAATPSDPNNDFNATQLLYQQVIASTYLLAPGVIKPSPGAWFEARPDSPQVDILGHVFTFGLELSTPLTDQPLAFAPVGVQPNPTGFLGPFAGGSFEQGFTG